jgi:DNA-binding CsgD family transcriptional regulator
LTVRSAVPRIWPISNAVVKLDARNKTHAATKALLLGWLV